METPIMLYALAPCADKIFAALQDLFPDHDFEAEDPEANDPQTKDPEGDWKEEVIVGTTGRLIKKKQKMIFVHRRDYYDGPEWPGQRTGMIQYFSKGSTPVARMERITDLISQFEFAISIKLSPVLADEDDRLGVVVALAEATDSVIFLPGVLLDSEFNRLHTVEGEWDEEARFPAGFESGTPPAAAGAAAPEARQKSEEDDVEGHPPPTADRVARRLLVLMTVAARGSMELTYNEQIDLGEDYQRLLDWTRALDLEPEMEAAEIDVIHAPPGSLSERQVIDSVWRTEGAAILAWALGLHEPSPYDEGTETTALLQELNFLQVEQAEAVAQDAALVSPEQRAAMQEEQLALHWRLREFSVRPEAMDFRAFGDTCWFGPTDLSWAQFGKDDDLAIKGVSISRASSDAVSMISSTAMERHLAINWLSGGGTSALYSETDTST